MQVTARHRLPGRVRLQVLIIQRQPILASLLEKSLQRLQGITDVRCNIDTARVLVEYDQKTITEEQLVSAVDAFVQMVQKRQPASRSQSQPQQPPAQESLSSITLARKPDPTPAKTSNPYRVPFVASAGLLGVGAIKRVLVGRSLMATAPIPFYMATGLSVITGYPLLRRRVTDPLEKRNLSASLWIGMSTLALAAVRENVVVLSAMTLLYGALYRKHQLSRDGTARYHSPPSMHDESVERYARNMSRTASVLAPAVWLATGSPLRALSVVLAANPRVAYQTETYAWIKQQQAAYRQGMPSKLVEKLPEIARSKTIVLSGTRPFFQDGQSLTIQPLSLDVDDGKILSLGGSLLHKVEQHAWRDLLVDEIDKRGRTLRTAFHVQEEKDGVQGVINGQETTVAEKSWYRRHGKDVGPILLAERRLRKQGYRVQIVMQNGEYIGILGVRQMVSGSWRDRIDTWVQQGYVVRSRMTEERVPSPLPAISEYEIRKLVSTGNPVLMIDTDQDDCFSDVHGVIRFRADEIDWLEKSMHQVKEVQSGVRDDLQRVRWWNRVALGFSVLTPIAAPLINLLGDAMGLFLVARQERLPRAARKAEVRGTILRLALPTLPASPMNVEDLDRRGLSNEEAQARLQKWGPNELPKPVPPRPLVVFFKQFADFATITLLATSVLSLGMGEVVNAAVMSSILVVNALIGTSQELRSLRVLESLKKEDVPQCTVIRDGQEKRLLASGLVMGDLVQLEAGDQVPADLFIVEDWHTEANEAMLTGESLPVRKMAGTVDTDTPMAERSNMLYMGTMITKGRVLGVVTATGSHTEMGRLRSLLQEENDTTPLQRRVSAIGKQFVIGAFAAGALVVGVGLLRGIPPVQLVLSAVTLAASAIPEGLPLTITIALTAGVMRMVKNKVVVRNLSSLEALGRVSVICTDKTGTLTRNEMKVQELAAVAQQATIDGKTKDAWFQEDQTDLRQLLRIGQLCNNANADKQMGDPTEIALLHVATQAQVGQDGWTRHREIPFDSNSGCMSVVCEETAASQECHIFTKGSPEVVLTKSTHYLYNGRVLEVNESIRVGIEERNREMAQKALRVLAFAYRPLQADESIEDAVDDGLIWVGMMGMIDPPKEGVAENIQEAHALGVKTVMITGDHPLTAQAIGEQLGIYQDGDRVVTGRDLDRMTPDELQVAVREATVFARVAPEHKLRIVEAYQKIGEVVAMTGDGVNDAPAIRKADVGIAMGKKGTDITKDTAGIVLTNDHFQSIVEGIKEGRKIIGNIRKSIGALLTGNLAEIMVGVTAVMVGLPMPLIPLQILLMNLLTDGLPAIVLAIDPHGTDVDKRYTDIMDRPLYRTVITRGLILGLGSVAAFAGALALGVPLATAQTMAFATLVAGQLIQTVAWRRHGSLEKVTWQKDRMLLGAMGISWIALIASMYIPAMQGLFGTTTLNPLHWMIVLGVAGSVTTLSSLILEKRQATATSIHVPYRTLEAY